jgi:hypothetical protein
VAGGAFVLRTDKLMTGIIKLSGKNSATWKQGDLDEFMEKSPKM